MISTFRYISPIQEAYEAVKASENGNGNNSNNASAVAQTPTQTTPQTNAGQENEYVRNPQKEKMTNISAEDDRRYYQSEIRRMKRLLKYFEQYNKQGRYMRGQGPAIGALENTIRKYEEKIKEIDASIAQGTNTVTQTVSQPKVN